MSFDPNSPTNRAKFLRDNPDKTDKDYDKIFGIKKEQPSFKSTDANRKKFLKDNPDKTNKDFDNMFKTKSDVKKKALGGYMGKVMAGRGGSFKGSS